MSAGRSEGERQEESRGLRGVWQGPQEFCLQAFNTWTVWYPQVPCASAVEWHKWFVAKESADCLMASPPLPPPLLSATGDPVRKTRPRETTAGSRASAASPTGAAPAPPGTPASVPGTWAGVRPAGKLTELPAPFPASHGRARP